MAMPLAPARPVPPVRTRRAWPALALAAAVLGGHAWLATWLAPDAPRAGLPRAAVVQLRSVVPAAAPRPAVPPPALAAPPPPQRASPRRAAPVAVQPPEAAPPLPVQEVTTAATTAPTAATPLPLADTAVAPGPAAPGQADSADGEPPPLYPALLPPPVQLRYTLHYNGRAGEALLVWQHDGAAYQLTLDGIGASGRPLVAQASQGGLDGHGLVPERFTDRRAAGRMRAASFRHDIGRIGFSGPAHTHPAWPGAQDRLSWLAQLAAILGAADAPPAALRLFVADAQGHAGLWQLLRQPDATGPSPWGELPQQHWQRTPPRPEGLQIDVWLAAAHTPAGHWPLRLRFAVPRSGDVFELVLQAAP